MFPDLEEDVIEAVLRANNGAVDATIDQLLTMNVDAGSSANSSINSSLKGPSADSFHEHSESYPYHVRYRWFYLFNFIIKQITFALSEVTHLWI